MLPRDKGGVVDPKLKVYGTKNIRVADLSILPLQISGHPQGRLPGLNVHRETNPCSGTVFAIGELGACVLYSPGVFQQVNKHSFQLLS